MLSILLIDDNPNDRLMIDRELRKAFSQLEIESVIDAKSLDTALENGGFDLIITDYQLHWNDGLTVLKKIKACYPNCPVIMCTDSGSEEVAVEGMKAGLSDYVFKGRHFQRLAGQCGKVWKTSVAAAVRINRRAVSSLGRKVETGDRCLENGN
ncbi:MAG: response regulator [Microcoleus sp. SU_5_6]|nr:response regulator [Microcoleus sp. SU_5_6]